MHFTHPLARCSMRAWLMQAIPNPALTILALFRSSRCGLVLNRRAARTSANFGGRKASSVLRDGRSVGDVARVAAVPALPPAGFADGGDHLPGHAQAAAPVVPDDVVHHQPEEWRQCAGASAGAGDRNLSHGLDAAPQPAGAP